PRRPTTCPAATSKEMSSLARTPRRYSLVRCSTLNSGSGIAALLGIGSGSGRFGPGGGPCDEPHRAAALRSGFRVVVAVDGELEVAFDEFLQIALERCRFVRGEPEDRLTGESEVAPVLGLQSAPGLPVRAGGEVTVQEGVVGGVRGSGEFNVGDFVELDAPGHKTPRALPAATAGSAAGDETVFAQLAQVP